MESMFGWETLAALGGLVVLFVAIRVIRGPLPPKPPEPEPEELVGPGSWDK